MENSMVLEYILERQVLKKKVYGHKESELNGLKKMDNQWKNEKKKKFIFLLIKKKKKLLCYKYYFLKSNKAIIQEL